MNEHQEEGLTNEEREAVDRFRALQALKELKRRYGEDLSRMPLSAVMTALADDPQDDDSAGGDHAE